MERHTVEESRSETPEVSPFDAPEERPGVPREAAPEPDPGAHWNVPAPQAGAGEQLRRAGLEEPTPVMGTAQPLHGLSGALRRAAYRIPERYARHWTLLLFADRVDVLESRLAPALAVPLERAGLHEASRRARANPLAALVGMAGAVWIARRVLAARR
ncbi:MAG TPA: hypothetical protein VFQ22_06865 [Longimicrobiales bacterium]|nr:hypothetical protein [Longimicrobiales bacterium]